MKRDAEDVLAQRLSKVIVAAEAKKAQADASATRRWDAEQQMARLRSEPVPAGALYAAERALRAVRGQADRDQREQRAAVAEVEREKKHFHVAQQERKSLERLRDKQFAAWAAEIRRQEQTEVDEVAARMKWSASRGQP
jgi:flagellar export protein FliJ